MNYIVLVSIATSLVGLFVIYLVAADMEIEVLKIDEISGELIGRTIATEGYIKNVRTHEDGHVFLTIEDSGKSIQVPIFSNLMQHMPEKQFKKGLKLAVIGLVDDYRGQIQIIPRKPQDVTLGDGA